MKRSITFCALIAIGAFAYASLPGAQAAGLGSIRGVVKDGTGAPLPGADVLVLAGSEETRGEKVVKRASTDGEGKFMAAGIAPGRYRVKAEAVGFNAVELAADVKPNKVTVFDSILLRRIGTLAEETNLNLDPKYASRRARPTIFQHNGENEEAEARRDALLAADRRTELHGAAQMFGQTSLGSDGGSIVAANFAITENIARDASLVVAGQVGVGEMAPQRLEILTTAHAGDRHRLAVALGYGRFTFSRHGTAPKLGQFSVSATDTWQVAGPVLVVYGLEFSRFTEGASGTSVQPRIGIAMDARPRTRLFAALVPGSSVDAQSKVNLESGEIVFSEPKPVALAANGEPLADRSYRLQFGGEQILSDKSSLEMMAFFDSVSGHGVGLLAIPLDRVGSETVLRSEEQSGRSRGLRVVYHRRVNKVVDSSIGYAVGEGQRLDARGVSNPGQLFSNGLFHVFSARINANFIGTGTKVSTVLRFAPDHAVFAIDPFQGQIGTYDPNVSVVLTQDLPSPGFLPGQWQAVVDLRNLLDQQASVADERQELVASRFHRLIRVGVALRF